MKRAVAFPPTIEIAIALVHRLNLCAERFHDTGLIVDEGDGLLENERLQGEAYLEDIAHVIDGECVDDNSSVLLERYESFRRQLL
jgi:hypothetical protein